MTRRMRLAGRPGPGIPGSAGLLVAGDWVGAEGMLSDASVASAKVAAGLAIRAVSAPNRTIVTAVSH